MIDKRVNDDEDIALLNPTTSHLSTIEKQEIIQLLLDEVKHATDPLGFLGTASYQDQRKLLIEGISNLKKKAHVSAQFAK